jgi:hypothetical protein
VSPPSELVVTPGPVVAICVHGPLEESARSSLNPLSLNEPSVQNRLIVLGDTGIAESWPGAIGIDCAVVPLATLEKGESPEALNAATR